MFPSSRRVVFGNCSTTTLSRPSKNLTFPSTLGIPTAVQHMYFTIKLSTLIFPLLACDPPLLNPHPNPYLFPFPLHLMMFRLRPSLLALPQSTIPLTWPSPPVQPHPHHQILHIHRRSTVPLYTQNLISHLMISLRHPQYPSSPPRSHKEGCFTHYGMFLLSRSSVIVAKKGLYWSSSRRSTQTHHPLEACYRPPMLRRPSYLLDQRVFRVFPGVHRSTWHHRRTTGLGRISGTSGKGPGPRTRTRRRRLRPPC